MKTAEKSLLITIAEYVHTWRILLLLYGSQAVSAVSGLAYGKLLAAYIPPEQVGQYNVQLAGGLLAYGCLVTPLIQSFKYTLQHQPSAATIRFYLGVLFRLCLAVGLVVALLIGLGYVPPLVSMVWLAISAQCCFAISNDYLNVTFQHRRYALLQILNPLLNLLLLLLLIVCQLAIAQLVGLWLCYMLLYSLLAVASWQKARQINKAFWPAWGWGTPAERKTLWAIYRPYAIPLMNYGLFGWVIVYADRYIINYLLTTTDVGYYSLGYSIGARIAIVATPLLTHLNPRVLAHYQQLSPVGAGHRLIRKYLLLFWNVSMPICLLLYLLNNQIGILLLSEAYKPAFIIVPTIAVASVVMLSIQFLETKFYATGQTKFVLWHCMAGALINVLLNLWLIPLYGIRGAAFAMVGSAFCQLLIVNYLFIRKS